MRGAVASGQAAGWRGSAAVRYARAQLRWLRWLAGRLRHAAAQLLAALADQWRRSLQLRVITATFLVSCLVVVVLGLESGADDYIVKPFQSKVLIARVRARLRRTDDPAPEMLSIGDVTIDVAGHAVRRAGEPLSLTPLEFDLLVALARKPRQVFTREVLLEQVWGYRHAADTRLVNVHVQRLRAKIEKDPEHPEIVVTVRGVGYKAGPG